MRAPKVPQGDLNIAFDRSVPDALINHVVEDIHNALMMINWASAKPEAHQRKLWDNGPYGHDRLSLKNFFGAYSPRLIKRLQSELRGLFAIFQSRQVFTVKQGTKAVFDTKARIMTVAPTTDTIEIVGMLAAALGIRNAVQLAMFIDIRGIAAANCIVSNEQMGSAAPAPPSSPSSPSYRSTRSLKS